MRIRLIPHICYTWWLPYLCVSWCLCNIMTMWETAKSVAVNTLLTMAHDRLSSSYYHKRLSLPKSLWHSRGIGTSCQQHFYLVNCSLHRTFTFMSANYYMVTLLMIDIFTDTSNSDVSPPTVCVSMPFPVASKYMHTWCHSPRLHHACYKLHTNCQACKLGNCLVINTSGCQPHLAALAHVQCPVAPVNNVLFFFIM